MLSSLVFMYILCHALSNLLRMPSKMALDFSACDPSNAMQGFMHCLQAQVVSCQLASVNHFERTTTYPAFWCWTKTLHLNVTLNPHLSFGIRLRSNRRFTVIRLVETPPRPGIYALQPNNESAHVVSPEASLDQQQRSLLLYFVICFVCS